MLKRGEQSTLSIDLMAGVAIVALIAVGSWNGLLRASPAKAELARIRSELEGKRRDLAGLEREAAHFETALREKQAAMASAGAPPARSPIEQDLRTLTELMRRHGLHVAEISPLGSTSYPGVLESKYRLRASGRCAELAQALRGFEGCRFWGDITSLQISSPAGSPGASGDTREADLTLSFYSAVQPQAAGTPETKP
jgi:hypothetical protein